MSQTLPEIVVCDYDPSWPLRYAEEVARLSPGLKRLRPQFHHIGSTAVPGLAAKPLIDIMMSVNHLQDAAVYAPLLEPLNYQQFAVDDGDRLLFVKGSPRTHHIHITAADGWHYWRFLLFRDYLRSNPEAARSYEALKRSSAALHAHDREQYTCSKTEFITSTVVRILQDRPDLAARLKSRGAPLP